MSTLSPSQAFYKPLCYSLIARAEEPPDTPTEYFTVFLFYILRSLLHFASSYLIPF